jgi:hypothetical protein
MLLARGYCNIEAEGLTVVEAAISGGWRGDLPAVEWAPGASAKAPVAGATVRGAAVVSPNAERFHLARIPRCAERTRVWCCR